LNRLTAETAVSGTNGYAAEYTYDLVGNRTQRVVTANGQMLCLSRVRQTVGKVIN
jgi:hypothetical protein